MRLLRNKLNTALVVALAGSLLITPAAAQAVPCAVTDVMIKASAAWVTKGTDLKANNWSNANFHTGNIAQVRTTGISIPPISPGRKKSQPIPTELLSWELSPASQVSG